MNAMRFAWQSDAISQPLGCFSDALMLAISAKKAITG